MLIYPVLAGICHAGKAWIKQMVCGAALFPALICGTAFLINFVAIYYHASRAIPILTMVTLPLSSEPHDWLCSCRLRWLGSVYLSFSLSTSSEPFWAATFQAHLTTPAESIQSPDLFLRRNGTPNDQCRVHSY